MIAVLNWGTWAFIEILLLLLPQPIAEALIQALDIEATPPQVALSVRYRTQRLSFYRAKSRRDVPIIHLGDNEHRTVEFDWTSGCAPEAAFGHRQYMDAPTCPGFRLVMAHRIRLHQYIRTFAAAYAAVPDGFC